ncbi:DUF58 domain-containing protein [Ureibacillus manganicus]|uniref:DUF58 domain-containing protein n=1 Tax=Ureibacillus manganicus TaxID=1266064 RepID=UPI0005679647|nr:DUF58 domain-containing protein [Ureibacillus manganicus]
MSKVKPVFKKISSLIVILLLIIITFSYAMFQGGFVSWFLFYSLIPFLLYSFSLALVPINIQNVHREIMPSVVERGDSVRVTIHFQNKTWFPLIFLTVREIDLEKQFFDKATGNISNIFFVGWKRKFEWTYEIRNLNRGQFTFQGLEFTVTDFFGWTVRKKRTNDTQSFTVYPRVTELKYQQIQMQYDQGGIASVVPIVKDTSMVTGVRDYQAGDRFSWIHWKSFAKNETLRTKEFEDRTTQHIFLCIDRTHFYNFEEVVDLSASILRSVVKNQGDISFLSYGDTRSFFPNIKTQSQFQKVLKHLATVLPDATDSIYSILTKELNHLSSSTFIFITGNFSDEMSHFFMNSSNLMRGAICFVVDDGNMLTKRNYPNVKVITLSKEHFKNAFTEVSKP